MFSYKTGVKIAYIQKLDKYIYLNDNNNNDGTFDKLETKEKIQVLPRKDIIEKLYISGVSGSGKSTYIGKYLKEFKKIGKFKNNPIYLFSSVSQDKVLDKYDPIRVPIDESLIEEPIEIDEFEDSITIFDDTNTIRNINYRKAVELVQGEIIEIGRHYNARIIVTTHMLSNWKQTRQILNEATSVTVFPKASGTYHIKNFLKTHCGLDKKKIERILNLPSRWLTVYRTYPNYIMWENGISSLDAV